MIVHLIDGTYELFRHFHGLRRFNQGKDAPYGAVIGVLRTVLQMIEAGATHLGVATDHVIESFRNDLFPGYKTGEGVPEELLSQFDLAEEVTRALGIVTWAMVEFEADDAISTAAARFAEDSRVEQVVIASPDKDLTQCVRGTRVVVWDRMRKIVLDEAGVRAKFGVPPEAIPDYLALVGDSADGFPGISGWGRKSAASVLERYLHIEAIPQNDSDWEVKPRRAYDLAAELRQEKEAALLYRRLATLRLDVPLAEEPDDLRWEGARREALRKLCQELREEVPTLFGSGARDAD